MNGELNTAKAVAVLNKYLLQQQCGNRMELQFFSEELQAQIEALSLASVRNELVTQLANLGKLICAELAGDFHLGYARQLTDKSSLLFDLAF